MCRPPRLEQLPGPCPGRGCPHFSAGLVHQQRTDCAIVRRLPVILTCEDGVRMWEALKGGKGGLPGESGGSFSRTPRVSLHWHDTAAVFLASLHFLAWRPFPQPLPFGCRCGGGSVRPFSIDIPRMSTSLAAARQLSGLSYGPSHAGMSAARVLFKRTRVLRQTHEPASRSFACSLHL